MLDRTTIKTLLHYSDWANGQLVLASAVLPMEQLDRVFDIGMGTLRRTLLHILAGESVWFQRWQGQRETPWPDEDEPVLPAAIGERFLRLYPQRDRFLAALGPEDLARPVIYRDSKGSLFSATLADMVIQMITHSMHHRSQAVNILRRLGNTPPELDYMMWVRKPA